MTTRVLVVDDDPHILRTLRIHLTARGYTVATAQTGSEALEVSAQTPSDVVVLDLGGPPGYGRNLSSGRVAPGQVLLSARAR
jgi:two-component system, OmpR family, KDP operon response regulator KdpE